MFNLPITSQSTWFCVRSPHNYGSHKCELVMIEVLFTVNVTSGRNRQHSTVVAATTARCRPCSECGHGLQMLCNVRRTIKVHAHFWAIATWIEPHWNQWSRVAITSWQVAQPRISQMWIRPCLHVLHDIWPNESFSHWSVLLHNRNHLLLEKMHKLFWADCHWIWNP